MARPQRAPRADNRLPLLLDEAARLFGAQGFHGTSIRDIVRAVAMLPGSIYYHFATKDLLLVAVYAEGVRRISERVVAAVAAKSDPWERLEAACVAHIEAVLEESGYRDALAAQHRVAMTITASAAASMIAWSASSPSSPAPAARRCAALGLDRSMRPNMRKPTLVLSDIVGRTFALIFLSIRGSHRRHGGLLARSR